MANTQTVIYAKEAAHTMGTWKARQIGKKNKASRTTGRSKGIVSSALERYMCRRNRSYKHPLYAKVLLSLTGEKRISKKGSK